MNISTGEVHKSTVHVHNKQKISSTKGLSVFHLPFKKKVTTKVIPAKSLPRTVKYFHWGLNCSITDL